ncbi:MAG: hypothetical protein ACTSYB_05775 [Candidatus Helarchaeota archaeon]
MPRERRSLADHVGQIFEEVERRMDQASSTKVISNLKELTSSANLTTDDIDKIGSKVINDLEFRALFIRNFKDAVKSLGIKIL